MPSLPRSAIKEYVIRRLTQLRSVRASLENPNYIVWSHDMDEHYRQLADTNKWRLYDAKIKELEQLYNDCFGTIELAC